jgi:hypothetical protein
LQKKELTLPKRVSCSAVLDGVVLWHRLVNSISRKRADPASDAAVDPARYEKEERTSFGAPNSHGAAIKSGDLDPRRKLGEGFTRSIFEYKWAQFIRCATGNQLDIARSWRIDGRLRRSYGCRRDYVSCEN